MRTALFDALFARMAHDKNVIFLTADMGLGLIERFEQAHPDRFLNVGIAEQNMIGVAAGLANVGYKPVCYTVSNFVIHRCFEQIRNEVGINGAPLVLIGTTVGYDNAPLGPTHATIDDWAALKAIPGIDIYCPASVEFASTILDQALDNNRPAYIRIPKGSYSNPFLCDHFMHLPGHRTCIVTSGTLVQEAVKAHNADKRLGVLALNQLRPLTDLTPILNAYDRIMVMDDQCAQGLYASICELQPRGRVEFHGPIGYDLSVAPTDAVMWRRLGIDAEGMTACL